MVINSKIQTIRIIKINNDELEIVNEFKYLGVILDNNLNFKAHYLCKKKFPKIVLYLYN